MEKKNTITGVVKKELCTGCGTCISLCPQSAIKLIKDSVRGIYFPLIIETKCTNCGMCFDVCPGHSIDFIKLNIEIFKKKPKDIYFGNYLNCYIGYASNYGIRYNSSSGGLVTSFLIYALENRIIDGALVTKMNKKNPLEFLPFIARTKEEIIEASKSKYCPVPANIALKEILKYNKKYAIVGLPCHIQGIRKAEQKNKKIKKNIILHIGIFCSNMPSFNATEFLLYKLKLCNDEVKRLDYRGKGWPGKMTIQMKNRKEIIIPYPSYWGEFVNIFFPKRCKRCLDWFSPLADISFGDAWLQEISKRDNIGTSIIITRSKKSEEILQQFARKNKVIPINIKKVIESQKGFSRKKRQIKAQLTILKLLGKRIWIKPSFTSLKPSLTDYISIIMYYALRVFTFNTFWLINTYCNILKIIKKILGK